MTDLVSFLRQQPIWFRVVFAALALFAVLPLLGSVVLVGATDVPFGADFKLYAEGGALLNQRLPLYDVGAWTQELNRRYPPPFFLGFAPLSGVPWPLLFRLSLPINVVVGLVALRRLYFLFSRYHPQTRSLRLWVLLPFSFAVSGALTFGNVLLVVLLLATLLAEAVDNRRWRTAGLALAGLALSKFFWAFPLVLFPLRRQWRGLVATVAFAAAALLGLCALYVAVVGPAYAAASLHDYMSFLRHADAAMIIHTPQEVAAHGTFQHSIHQTLARYFGAEAWMPGFVWGSRVVLAGVLCLVLGALLRLPRADLARRPAAMGLALIAAYCVVMTIQPQMQEAIFMGPAVAYLWSVSPPRSRPFLWLLIPYLFLMPIELVAVATGTPWLDLYQHTPIVLCEVLGCLAFAVWVLFSGACEESAASGTEVGASPG
jgi:hypothetical protein